MVRPHGPSWPKKPNARMLQGDVASSCCRSSVARTFRPYSKSSGQGQCPSDARSVP